MKKGLVTLVAAVAVALPASPAASTRPMAVALNPIRDK